MLPADRRMHLCSGETVEKKRFRNGFKNGVGLLYFILVIFTDNNWKDFSQNSNTHDLHIFSLISSETQTSFCRSYKVAANLDYKLLNYICGL